jgi:hypothetical protein
VRWFSATVTYTSGDPTVAADYPGASVALASNITTLQIPKAKSDAKVRVWIQFESDTIESQVIDQGGLDGSAGTLAFSGLVLSGSARTKTDPADGDKAHVLLRYEQ